MKNEKGNNERDHSLWRGAGRRYRIHTDARHRRRHDAEHDRVRARVLLDGGGADNVDRGDGDI